MWSSVVYEPGEGITCTVSGAFILVLQQYTYLGLTMTVDLNFNAIVQDGKEKATNAYHAMRQFFTRSYI